MDAAITAPPGAYRSHPTPASVEPVRVRRPIDIDPTSRRAAILFIMVEDEGKKEEDKFEFDSADRAGSIHTAPLGMSQ